MSQGAGIAKNSYRYDCTQKSTTLARVPRLLGLNLFSKLRYKTIMLGKMDRFRVIVSLGPGGVGKTTVSAAMAVRAALGGKSVLCLTIDPANRLASNFGLEEASNEGRWVDDLMNKAGLQSSGRLKVAMLDPKKMFDELVVHSAGSRASAQSLLNNKIYQLVSGSLSGTREYMAIERVLSAVNSGDFDLIIVDTPPAANAHDFLLAPDKLMTAIDSPAAKWFLQFYGRATHGAGGVMGKAAKMAFNTMASVTGAAFLREVGEFVTEMDVLFGGFRSRAHATSRLLRSEEVGYVLITRPNASSLEETAFIAQWLDNNRFHSSGAIFNATHGEVAYEDLTARYPECESVMEPDLLSEVQNAMQQSIEQNNKRAMIDASQIRHFLDSTAVEELATLPLLQDEVYEITTLARLANILGEQLQGSRS